MSITTNPPGLMLPTQKSYTPGTGNPYDSAMASKQITDNKLNNLNNSVSGGSIRRKKGGSQAQVVVPTFTMLYPPQGGNGTNPNDQVASNSSRSMQSTAWAANDSQATKITPPPKIGGTRRKRRGGSNSNWKWGCYSGGKNTRKRFNKNKRNHKKKSKRRFRR